MPRWFAATSPRAACLREALRVVRRRNLCCWVSGLAIACGTAIAQTTPEPATSSPGAPLPAVAPRGESRVPQTLAEFLDSLSDSAINADRSQVYRLDGRGRVVQLGRGWIAAFDEQNRGRLTSIGSGPGTAGPPGQMLEFARHGERTDARLYTQRDSTGRENGASLGVRIAPGWTARWQGVNVSDTDTGIRRRDVEGGLRWGGESLWGELLLRQARLDDPRASTPLADPSPRGRFGGLKAQWLPESVPGLTIGAVAEKGFGGRTAAGEERLAGDSVAFGADYRLGIGAWRGTRLYWREALRESLLGSAGFEERNSYRRTLGVDLPDGSADGVVYLQSRQRSLLDDRDALLVAGWRHVHEPAPRWRVEILVERAQPVGGPNAVGSTTLGLRVANSAHPHHTALVETELVRSPIKDSSYLSTKYTQRLTENTLGALRLSVTDNHPFDPAEVPTTDWKAAVGWGWREPESKLFNTLWRYSLIGRDAHVPDVVIPGLAHRRAHVLFGSAGWQAEPRTLLSLRGSRRWDHDQSFEAGALHTTDLWVVRAVRQLDEHLSFSAHLATRRDSAQGHQNGLGAELGVRLSRKVALAFGYNPRGIDDSELQIDDKLGKGWTLRLRFSFESALGRWLDPAWPLPD